MSRYPSAAFLTLTALLLSSCQTKDSSMPTASASFPASYAGTPFQDSKYPGGPQKIPGTVHCAYYDLGGEGVAYHDADPVNNGSGKLNPLNGTYLHEFRHTEGVDISFTKFYDAIDNSPFNRVTPPEGLLYVGWTEPGEWFNLTVDVAETATYSVDILYTSNKSGQISFDINHQPAGRLIHIASTFDAADPIAWRQWHHWNLHKNAIEMHLTKGKNLLTLRIIAEGQMNFATLQFTKISR